MSITSQLINIKKDESEQAEKWLAKRSQIFKWQFYVGPHESQSHFGFYSE